MDDTYEISFVNKKVDESETYPSFVLDVCCFLINNGCIRIFSQ